MSIKVRLMADRARPFSEVELRALRHRGFAAVAGYLGGQTPCPWSAEDFRRAAHLVGPLLPIWVLSPHEMSVTGGQHAGAQAVAALRRLWRPGRQRRVVLDVESGYYRGRDTVRAAEAWRAAVREGGYRPVLYSGPAVIDAVTGRTGVPHHLTAGWSGVWVAHWTQKVYPPRPRLRDMDTRWRSLVGRRAWQYAGETAVGELIIDASVTDMMLNPAPLG
jgi:hypothetical protein